MTDYITPQERADYGDEFLNVVAKQARASTAAEVQQLQAGMNELHQAVQREQRRHMTAQLDKHHPEWRGQNKEPGFLQWLHGRDPFSGTTRQALLDQAWQSGAADRVLNIFQAYRKESRQRPAQQHQSGTGAQPVQASPGVLWPLGTRGAITQRQIQNYHRMVVEGRFAHAPQEKLQRDEEMIRAAREGRIVP
jgi:hypothetical protein